MTEMKKRTQDLRVATKMSGFFFVRILKWESTPGLRTKGGSFVHPISTGCNYPTFLNEGANQNIYLIFKIYTHMYIYIFRGYQGCVSPLL